MLSCLFLLAIPVAAPVALLGGLLLACLVPDAPTRWWDKETE